MTSSFYHFRFNYRCCCTLSHLAKYYIFISPFLFFVRSGFKIAVQSGENAKKRWVETALRSSRPTRFIVCPIYLQSQQLSDPCPWVPTHWRPFACPTYPWECHLTRCSRYRTTVCHLSLRSTCTLPSCP